MLCIGLLIFMGYIIDPRGENLRQDSMTYSVKVLTGTFKSMEDYNLYSKQRETFIPKKTDIVPPKNNLVLILDESIRGDYLSINSPGLNTTPLLEKYLRDYPKNIFNYGLTLSTATNTFLSGCAILTGLDHIPDEEFRVFSAPTLFDIAKANGYKTVMLALQASYPDFVIRQADLDRIDTIYVSDKDFMLFDNEKNIDSDLDEADILHKRLKEESGLFVFLYKIGLHSPYQIRYPVNSENDIFTPSLGVKEQFSPSKRREIINSYKNALHYNVDGFFKRLLGDNPEELKDCTIIYTSDHAESLFERGVGLHSTGIFEQTIVPFLIFSTDSWVLENLKHPDEIPFTLHHMNIAPTIQSILCRDLEHSSGDYSSLVSKENFKQPPLVYISKGAVWEGEISSPVSVDENGKMILPVEKYMY